MSGTTLDPVALCRWLTQEPADQLELVEDEFWNIAEGLPFERTTGELVASGRVSRAVAARIARAIREFRLFDVELFTPLAELAEALDTAEAETTLKRLEDTWRE